MQRSTITQGAILTIPVTIHMVSVSIGSQFDKFQFQTFGFLL
jgi:hypothetical protein